MTVYLKWILLAICMAAVILPLLSARLDKDDTNQ